eukprot:CAMPEP_0194198086 /NCGR_PEP_ID=MMETSP0154-20130528/77567_1 /TAXON_ID=1049557 /ORGANISM="Thalassiothrix antarctica, Strain L6-D1" /LENGTH=58 /DNA_ID=CAMNT_0038922833 /DNA_START=544 /DNA_END=717 /DNA_ORIENTATION=-
MNEIIPLVMPFVIYGCVSSFFEYHAKNEDNVDGRDDDDCEKQRYRGCKLDEEEKPPLL